MQQQAQAKVRPKPNPSHSLNSELKRKRGLQLMGEWEQATQEKCADCGAFLRVKHEHSRGKRIDQPLHFYAVGDGTTRRKICPACWTTARTAPQVGALQIG